MNLDPSAQNRGEDICSWSLGTMMNQSFSTSHTWNLKKLILRDCDKREILMHIYCLDFLLIIFKKSLYAHELKEKLENNLKNCGDEVT